MSGGMNRLNRGTRIHEFSYVFHGFPISINCPQKSDSTKKSPWAGDGQLAGFQGQDLDNLDPSEGMVDGKYMGG